MKTYLFIAFITCSLAIQSGQVSANSIFGDTFNVTFNGVGGVTGIADNNSRFDVNTLLNNQNLEINWTDADSFDFAFFGGGGGDDISYTLSNLDFQDTSGNDYKIVGANFNMGDSNVQGFLASPSNPTGVPLSEFISPTLSFTDNSVTAFFPRFNEQLAADGPTLRYDLQLAPAQPLAVIPLPSTLLLMASGIAALTGLSRKKN